MLIHNHTLRVLNLYNNKIGVKGARRLAVALKEIDTLQQLYLGWNHIGDKGAQALADSLSVDQSLCQIWLNSNRIGDKGAYKLVSALAHNHVPKQLMVEGNHISNMKKTIVSISDSVTQRDCEMRINEKQIAQRERTIERKEKELASKDEEIASLKEALERQLAERSRKIEGNGITSVDAPELVSKKTQHVKKRRHRAPLHDFAKIAMEKEKNTVALEDTMQIVP